jgi:hypothetical protein
MKTFMVINLTTSPELQDVLKASKYAKKISMNLGVICHGFAGLIGSPAGTDPTNFLLKVMSSNGLSI